MAEQEDPRAHDDWNYVVACSEMLDVPEWSPNRNIWSDLTTVATAAIIQVTALETQLSTLSSSLREANDEIRRLKSLADDHFRNGRSLAERLAALSRIDNGGEK